MTLSHSFVGWGGWVNWIQWKASWKGVNLPWTPLWLTVVVTVTKWCICGGYPLALPFLPVSSFNLSIPVLSWSQSLKRKRNFWSLGCRDKCGTHLADLAKKNLSSNGVIAGISTLFLKNNNRKVPLNSLKKDNRQWSGSIFLKYRSLTKSEVVLRAQTLLKHPSRSIRSLRAAACPPSSYLW